MKTADLENGKRHIDICIASGMSFDNLINNIPRWVKYTEQQRNELLKYFKAVYIKYLKDKQIKIQEEILMVQSIKM